MGYVFGLFIGKKNKPIPCCLYNNNCWVFVLSFSDVLSYSLYSRRLKLIKTSEILSPNPSQSNENIYNMHKKRKNITNKPSPAKVGSNKLRMHIGFDLSRIRQTQL